MSALFTGLGFGAALVAGRAMALNFEWDVWMLAFAVSMQVLGYFTARMEGSNDLC